ncbi:hypothetical protein L7F22_002643 [Adiantum nelumboides]|nr:hypothetical protein [Adiantum nelumboides]
MESSSAINIDVVLGYVVEAFNCLEQMQLEGVLPNTATFVCSLNACSSLKAGEEGQAIHLEIVKRGLLAADLFNDYVLGVLAEKTVVLDTHQVKFLPAVNCTLVMQGGEIQQSGRYHNLLHAGEIFGQLVNAHQDALTSVSFGETARTNDGHGEMNPMQKAIESKEE